MTVLAPSNGTHAPNGEHSNNGSHGTNGAKKFSRLNDKELGLIIKLIMKHADIDEESKTVTYHSGWDDARILAELHRDLSRRHLALRTVIVARREQFGMTKAERRSSPRTGFVVGIKARLSAVEERLATLEGAILGR